jgi:hypothetical protein
MLSFEEWQPLFRMADILCVYLGMCVCKCVRVFVGECLFICVRVCVCVCVCYLIWMKRVQKNPLFLFSFENLRLSQDMHKAPRTAISFSVVKILVLWKLGSRLEQQGNNLSSLLTKSGPCHIFQSKTRAFKFCLFLLFSGKSLKI